MKYDPIHYRVVGVQYHCETPTANIEEARTVVEQGEFLGNSEKAYYVFPQQILDKAQELAKSEGYDAVWVETATPEQAHWNHWRRAYGFNVLGTPVAPRKSS